VTSESSSAANVRRIEALTGPAAIELLRRSDHELARAARVLRTSPENVAELVEEREQRRRELEKAARAGAAAEPIDLTAITQRAVDVDGVRLLAEVVPLHEPRALVELADRVKNALGDSAVVLGGAGDDRVHLVATVAPSVVQRGVRAGDVVRAAAAVVGGGGGGRDTMAQAGGRDPAKLGDALAVARSEIERALSG
jgi:alanyl-tRNA synthetase